MHHLATRSLLALVALAGLAVSVVHADDKPVASSNTALAPAAESTRVTALQPGDKAPALEVESFLKGDAINEFKAGHVYVVEAWATWCGPCIRMFPHLSDLQKEYAGKVTFVGVNLWEARRGQAYTPELKESVKKFIDGQGDRMAYTVAYDGEAKRITTNYMEAAKQNGIPAAFVVDGNGVVAWIGHPAEIDDVLKAVVEGSWDVNKARDEFVSEMQKEARQMKLMEDFQAAMESLEGQDAAKQKETLAKLKTLAKEGADTNFGPNFAIGTLMAHWQAAKDIEGGNAYAKELASGTFKDNARALNYMAWTLVDPENPLTDKPDLDLALSLAEQADKASEGKSAEVLDTLARVHFARGDKAKAIETQTKAISLETDAEAKQALEKTLETYKQ
jgi:thiol-disulfide isomerase/thioredoxin